METTKAPDPQADPLKNRMELLKARMSGRTPAAPPPVAGTSPAPLRLVPRPPAEARVTDGSLHDRCTRCAHLEAQLVALSASTPKLAARIKELEDQNYILRMGATRRLTEAQISARKKGRGKEPGGPRGGGLAPLIRASIDDRRKKDAEEAKDFEPLEDLDTTEGE